MNTYFKSALNQVQADEALKNKTKEYVSGKLQMQARKINLFFPFKRYAFASLMSVVILSGLGFFVAYQIPVAYMSLDINPSVEIGVNFIDHVVSTEAYNDDGTILVNQLHLYGENLDQAITELIKAANETGYIAEDGTTVISLTAVTNDSDKGLVLETVSTASAKQTLMDLAKDASIINDQVGLERREEARDLGITSGKLNLIQKLQEVDPTVTIDSYINASVKEIVEQTNEMRRQQREQRQETENGEDSDPSIEIEDNELEDNELEDNELDDVKTENDDQNINKNQNTNQTTNQNKNGKNSSDKNTSKKDDSIKNGEIPETDDSLEIEIEDRQETESEDSIEIETEDHTETESEDKPEIEVEDKTETETEDD